MKRTLGLGAVALIALVTNAPLAGATPYGGGLRHEPNGSHPAQPSRPSAPGRLPTATANSNPTPLTSTKEHANAAGTNSSPSGRARIVVKKVPRDAKGFDLVGGQEAAVRELREAIELPLTHPEAFARMGIEPVRGILLSGPPGTGKTALARAVAQGLNAKMFELKDVRSKFQGESEANIRKVFEEAAANAPAVIFIDEIDAIAGKRDKSDAHDVGLTTELQKQLDGMTARKGVVVIAATNRPGSLDPALRREGRFDREVAVHAPDAQGRADILAIHSRKMPLANDVDLAAVAHATDGMSGADLKSVARTAGMSALRRDLAKPRAEVAEAPAVHESMPSPGVMQALQRAGFTPEHLNDFHRQFAAEHEAQGIEVPSRAFFFAGLQSLIETVHHRLGHVPGDVLADVHDGELQLRFKRPGHADMLWTKKLPRTAHGSTGPAHDQGERVTHADFMDAVAQTKPSTVREYSVEAPKVHWSDIAGLHDAKERLRDAVERPLTNPEGFARLGLRAPKGVLLYGPPGTGKTLLAKAVATESHANFISVKASDLVSKWHGESSQNIAELFSRARAVSPAVIFIDEIDALAPPREGLGPGDSNATRQVVTQLLQELDGVESLKGVTVVAATNHPDGVDSALRRPGRFDSQIYIGMPDVAARRQAFDVHTKKMPLAAGVDLDKLAKRTQGFTGADIESICMKAGYLALRKDHDAGHVSMSDFEAVLSEARPSVTPEMERRYLAMDKPQAGKPAAKISFGFTTAKP